MPCVVICQEELLSLGSGPLTMAAQAQCLPPSLSLRKHIGAEHRLPRTRLHLLWKAPPIWERLPWLCGCTMPQEFLNWHQSLEGAELWVWTDHPGLRPSGVCQNFTGCRRIVSLWVDCLGWRERQNLLPHKFSVTFSKWKE